LGNKNNFAYIRTFNVLLREFDCETFIAKICAV